MLGIDFLNQRGPLNFAGMEFMDYVSSDLYPALVKFYEKHIITDVEAVRPEFKKINISKESVEELKAIVFPATGMNVMLYSDITTNMGVDIGYLTPQNVLNTPMFESMYEAKDTTIARAMKVLKTDVLKGWVDTSTGKLGGDFSKIEFGLFCNPWVDEIIRSKFLARYKCTMSEALAMFTLHELGHIFTTMLFITRSCFDAVLPSIAIKVVSNKKLYGKERMTIVNDTLKELDIPPTAKVAELDKMDENGLVMYFSKAINNRDMHRTLSLGTSERGPELLADLYAARMGCPKSLIAGIASVDIGFPEIMLKLVAAAAITSALFSCTVLTGLMGTLLGATLLLKAWMVINPGSEYDSPYRRVKAILRDTIVRLNEDKAIDKRTKIKMLADAKEMEKMVEQSKTFLEGTAIQRVVGYLFSGTDFRAQDFENYTDELIGHTLSLYKETF